MKNKIVKTKRDNATNVVAALHSVTPSYVSKIMADKKHIVYKGVKAMAIRKSYLRYKKGNQRLVRQLQTQKAA